MINGQPRVRLKRGYKVVGLVGYGFKTSPYYVVFAAAARKPANCAAGVHIPVGRAQPRKGGNNVNPRRIGNGKRRFFAFGSRGYKPQFIAQPLNDRAAHKHAALKRVAYIIARVGGNGGYKSVFAFKRGAARIHKQKAARAVGIFNIAPAKAFLPEKRRLLVACNARNRYFRAQNIYIAVNFAA